ncbi:hypothetical protein PTKIN_Ptkin08bG0061400 [Pterospermum kingtungense]
MHQAQAGCHLDSSAPLDSDWRSFRARLVAVEKASSRLEDPSSVVDHPPQVTIGDKWAHTIYELEKGCLLIATEKLEGSTFSTGRWSCSYRQGP